MIWPTNSKRDSVAADATEFCFFAYILIKIYVFIIFYDKMHLKLGGAYMDILDIYDKYRNLTGRKMLKNQYSDLRENEFTLFTYLAIFNEDNE